MDLHLVTGTPVWLTCVRCGLTDLMGRVGRDGHVRQFFADSQGEPFVVDYYCDKCAEELEEASE